MKKVRPLGKRVLVRRTKAEMSKGGILLPESAQEKPKEGSVVAVGPGEMSTEGKMIKPSLKEGDRVLFTSYSGTEVKALEGDEEFLLMSEDDVLAVLS